MSEKVYGIFRVQKIKVSNGGGLRNRIEHSTREFVADNVDKTRLKFDEKYGAENYAEAIAKIRELWAKADTKRSDSVGVLETLITTTGILPKGEESDFVEKSIEQLKKMYGENLVCYFVHKDEKEAHIHAFSVPLETKEVEKKHLSADEIQKLKTYLESKKIKFQNPPKRPKAEADPKEWEKYKKAKKDYEKFKKEIKPILKELGFSKIETTLSCQSICGSSAILSKQQDLWHKAVFKQFGLARGGEDEIKRSYRNPTKVHKWAENLEAKELKLKEKIENQAQSIAERVDVILSKDLKTYKLPWTKKELQAQFLALGSEHQALKQEIERLRKDAQTQITAHREAQKRQDEKIINQLKENLVEAQKTANKAKSEAEELRKFDIRKKSVAELREIANRKEKNSKSQEVGRSER